MKKKGPDSYCYNCHHPIQEGDVYCANCGQKHHTGKHTIGKFVSDFFYTNFSIDNRFFRSLAGLFRPGFLTKQYFKGKHKRYNTPIQIFLVIAVIFFTLAGWSINDGVSGSQIFNIQERIVKQEMQKKSNALLDSVAIRTNDQALLAHIDTLKYSDLSAQPMESDTSDNLNIQHFQFLKYQFTLTRDTIKLDDVKIPIGEMANKTPSQLVAEYLPDYKWYEKIIARQALRFGLDTNAMEKFLMSRFPLLILIVTPLFALMLKLLYIRKNVYFVEHFVFSLHLNSASLLFCLIAFLLTSFCNFSAAWVAPISLLVWVLYYYKSLRKYYGQSRWKTLLKFILANFLSTIVGAIALVIIFIIAFLIF